MVDKRSADWKAGNKKAAWQRCAARGQCRAIWEISVKSALGRLDILDAMEEWVPRLEKEWGVSPLPINFEHAMALRALPPLHNDPFDRMLVAQAQCEDLTLITGDPAVMAYNVRTIDALE